LRGFRNLGKKVKTEEKREWTSEELIRMIKKEDNRIEIRPEC